MTKAKKNEAGFEKDLEGLEGIVTALEEGGLSLDDALKQFEEGIKLARRCEKALTDAEKRIEMLTKNAEGEVEAKPFDESAEPPAKPAPAPRAASAPPHDLDEPPIVEPPEEDEDELLF